jgi:uncharacterized metal-binding protein YceD (DUF177 family)
MGKVMKEYVIPIYGLKPGKHHYDFQLDQSLFEVFDSELIRDADLSVVLELEKTSNMIQLNFSASGQGRVDCDRCGDDLTLTLDCSEKVIVKFSEEPNPADEDEIIVLAPSDHELDVSRRIYEMIVLNMPKRRVHEHIKDCNQEAIARLSTSENREEDDIDPRWEALRKLK